MERLERIGRFPAESAGEAAVAIRQHGAAVIEGVWPCETIDRVRETVLAQHPEFGQPELMKDFLGKADRRFVAPVTVSPAVAASGLLAAPALEALCVALLGEDFVYEAFGMLMVHPGVEAQHSHRDGGLLFPETGIDKILPPSALTLAIPLVDIDEPFGPTGLATGTHRDWIEAESAELEPIELRRGDMAVWDFRVVHAGLANRTDRSRPALYLTACRPFWVDHKNFGKKARVKLAVDPAAAANLGPRFVRAHVAS